MGQFLLIIFLFFNQITSFAKVDPPNYDFSVDKFQLFMPGKTLEEISKSYKTKEVTFKENAFTTYKFWVEHLRYRFPIFVQFKGGVVTDFHARLPAYFLHDVFHQSLINRIGNQDIYKKREEQALYVWKNKKGLKHTYSAGCSITCFPIFYVVEQVEHSHGSGYETILNKLTKKEPKI